MTHKEKYFVSAFLIIYVIRLIVIGFMGLMPQDAYYYFYSEHLAMSYFDHPPMVAYMLKFFSLFFGKSVFVVKLTDFLVTLFSFFSFYYLCNLFLSKNKAMQTTLLFGTTFIVTLLSINTTPDVPLILFWILSLIALFKAVFENKLVFWILSGILMGLAFDSKYTGLFLLFGLFTFLLFSKKHRKFLFSKEILLTVLFFLITISPIFIWNYQNDWLSFKFQSTDRVSSGFNLSPKLFFGNIGTQMLLLMPILFGAIFFSFYKLGKKSYFNKRLPEEKILFLISFSLPIIAFFFLISSVYWVKINWIIPGYLAAIILTGRYLSEKAVRIQLISSIFLHVLFFILIVFYPINIKSDDTWYGWEKLTEEVKLLKKDRPDSFIFSDDGYKTSAVLNFYLNENVYAGNVVGKNGLQFSIVYKDLSFLESKNALFLDSDKKLKSESKSNKTPEELVPYFDSIIELEPILIKNDNGVLLRKFYVFECKNYKINSN